MASGTSPICSPICPARPGKQNRRMDLGASVGLHFRAAEVGELAGLLAERLRTEDTPDLRMAKGLSDYMRADFDAGAAELERAFLGFQAAGLRRRAAVAATHLGRLQYDGIGNAAVASGWFARGRRLLAGDEGCVERGWVALGTVGCSVPSPDRLEEDAALAMRLAHEHGDVDLECKALADSGLAYVRQGRVAEGTERLDESMAMISSGECDNQFIAAQVMCCLVTACERSGDLSRLEGWLFDRVRREELLPERAPRMLYAHCQAEYGSLLCHVGRWSEADSTLRLAVAACDSLHFVHRASSRAGLATLRVWQGRLHEAAALLDGVEQRPEAQLALARLHHARGDHDLAAVTLRAALRLMAGDRMGGAAMLSLLVQAELGRGNEGAAAEAAEQLELAVQGLPGLQALAALATGRVQAARGDTAAAVASFGRGLQLLGSERRPMVAAELHLALAAVLPDTDRVEAVTHARAALSLTGPIGAQPAHEVQSVLRRLGVSAVPAQVSGPSALTSRERDTLRLLGEGLSNPQIAERLVISRKTAEHHVSAVLRKLHLRSRGEAALYAASLAG